MGRHQDNSGASGDWGRTWGFILADSLVRLKEFREFYNEPEASKIVSEELSDEGETEGVWTSGAEIVPGRPGHYEFQNYSDKSAVGEKIHSKDEDPETMREKFGYVSQNIANRTKKVESKTVALSNISPMDKMMGVLKDLSLIHI